MDKPDDRLKKGVFSGDEDKDTDPKIYLVVNNQKFLRPGLETYYAKPGANSTGAPAETGGCSCNPVTGTYCSCNKVCTCNPQCSCQGHSSCSCESHTSGGGSYCSCVPVH